MGAEEPNPQTPVTAESTLASKTAPAIAVIGAGIAGLSAASRVRELGLRVRVIEKSRGMGGRSATRRIGRLGFDHGAQYLTVREPALEKVLTQLIQRGVVARWEPRIVRLASDGARTPGKDAERFVGVPGMSMLGRGLRGQSIVTLGTRIMSVALRSDGTWTLLGEHGAGYGPFAGVIVTCPASQAADLLESAAPELARTCGSVKMLPCWATMVAFDFPLGLDFDAAFVDDEVLAWVANESTKPGRSSQPECWTVHAAPAWSRERLEDDADLISRQMLQRFFEIAGTPAVEPSVRISHRWRFARSAEPMTQGNLLDAARHVGVAGDWTHGDRLEGAFMSGRRMAEELAGLLGGESS